MAVSLVRWQINGYWIIWIHVAYWTGEGQRVWWLPSFLNFLMALLNVVRFNAGFDAITCQHPRKLDKQVIKQAQAFCHLFLLQCTKLICLHSRRFLAIFQVGRSSKRSGRGWEKRNSVFAPLPASYSFAFACSSIPFVCFANNERLPHRLYMY